MKRFRYLRKYVKLLKKNQDLLINSRVDNNPSGIRYDWLYRLYTVVNFPKDDQSNIKRYGVYYVDNMVQNHVAKMNQLLLQLGILEYVELDTKNIIQIDELNVKIVLKFKYINMIAFFRFLMFAIPSILLIGIILLLIL
jgi:hypothetical protein